MVPGLLWGPDILRALGVPPDLLADAWAYLRVTVFGFPLLFIAVFGRSILAGEGDVRLPVMIQLAGTVANIVLDPILIFGLGLGVVGAALATVIAQAGVALAFVYLLLVRRRGYVELRLSRLRPHAETINAILRIGAPASLSMVVMSIGGGAFNRILVAHSADAVAAHQIGNRLDHIVILPMVALAMSLVTLVGMFHGAGRADLLIGIVRYALTRAIAIGFVLSALMYAGAPAIIGVFTDSEAIHRLGVRYLHTLAFAYPFFPISMLTGRALQGLGRGTPELVLSLLRVLLIAVPLAWLTTFVWHWPVHWVWISMVISSLISAATAGLWLASGLRQVVDRAASALAAGAGEVKHQSALESTP
jgi:putative MATE family efflux protein